MPSLSFGEISDRLVALGLDAPLAETYLHLLMQGTIRPAAFATVLQASRSEGYRRLNQLAECGLASSQGQPITFHAVGPEELFRLLDHSQQKQAEAIHNAVIDLEPLLNRPRAAAGAEPCQTFRYLAGRPAFTEELHRLLDLAREEVLVVNTHPSGAALAERAGLWPRMQQLEEDGILPRIVMTDHPSLRRRSESCAIRVLPQAEFMNFVIVDRRATVFCTAIDESSSMHGPSEECVATGAPSLLAAQLTLFERLWRVGKALDPETSFREKAHYPEDVGPGGTAPLTGGPRT